jgi:hypothetical protein
MTQVLIANNATEYGLLFGAGEDFEGGPEDFGGSFGFGH